MPDANGATELVAFAVFAVVVAHAVPGGLLADAPLFFLDGPRRLLRPS
jgi:hypothetical protein